MGATRHAISMILKINSHRDFETAAQCQLCLAFRRCLSNCSGRVVRPSRRPFTRIIGHEGAIVRAADPAGRLLRRRVATHRRRDLIEERPAAARTRPRPRRAVLPGRVRGPAAARRRGPTLGGGGSTDCRSQVATRSHGLAVWRLRRLRKRLPLPAALALRGRFRSELGAWAARSPRPRPARAAPRAGHLGSYGAGADAPSIKPDASPACRSARLLRASPASHDVDCVAERRCRRHDRRRRPYCRASAAGW